MGTIASQITSLTIVYSIVYSDPDQRKNESSASLAFVWGIHRDRWIPRTKGQLRGKCFHLMTSSWNLPAAGETSKLSRPMDLTWHYDYYQITRANVKLSCLMRICIKLILITDIYVTVIGIFSENGHWSSYSPLTPLPPKCVWIWIGTYL